MRGNISLDIVPNSNQRIFIFSQLFFRKMLKVYASFESMDRMTPPPPPTPSSALEEPTGSLGSYSDHPDF